MPNYYDYLTDSGVITPDVSDVKTDVQNEFTELFGTALDLTASTPQGRLIELFTMERSFVLNLCAALANQVNLDTASGQFLDAIASFFGISRFKATRTRVLVTVTGVPNTVIPAGSLVKNDDGKVFFFENNCTIQQNGQNTAYVLAQEYGAIPCAINSLKTIISQILGWESVINQASATIGSEDESDYSLRQRIKKARYSGVSLLQDVNSALSAVENIRSSFVYNNPTSETVVYDSVSVPPHSILAVVDGGTNLDVATALFDKVSAGCGYAEISGQSVSQTVIDGAYGVAYDVVFNRPEEINFEVNISVNKNNYTGDNLVQEVKNAILFWAGGNLNSVEGLRIGRDVSPFEIAAAVSEQIPDIYIKSCLICNIGETPSANELVYTISQVGRLTEDDITVEVV